jgi:tryptophanyl-tRNA synthetase
VSPTHPRSPTSTRSRSGGIGYGEVKAQLAEVIDTHVASMRDSYQRLLTNPGVLDARLADGEHHARRRRPRARPSEDRHGLALRAA